MIRGAGRDGAGVADRWAGSFQAQAAEVARVAALGERVETEIDGCRVVWRCWGSGPPIVLLHGGSGAWTHWLRNVEALVGHGRRVLAPDMPGYGESGNVPLPHSAARVADIVGRSFEQVPGARDGFPLVGFSFGTVVAGHWAAARRAPIERLVLVGATGLGIRREREFDLRGWKHLPDPDAVLAVHRHNLAVLMLRDAASIDPLALYLQALNTDRTRFVSRFASRGDALAGLLAAIGAPVSGIWGEHDVTAVDGVEHHERLLRACVADVRFDLVDGAGHWVQFERADAFNRVLLATVDAD